MPLLSPELQARYEKILKPILDDATNKAMNLVIEFKDKPANQENVAILNQKVEDLLDKAQFVLDKEYQDKLHNAVVGVRGLHQPQKALDPINRQMVNENEAELSQSARAPHPERKFDGANVRPNSRPNDRAPGAALITAQDLSRDQNDQEFKNELRNRLTARLSMPGPSRSRPRPENM